METKHKVLFTTIFIVSFVAAYSFSLPVSKSTLQIILGFLSIIVGFQITTIAVLFGSTTAAKLYLQQYKPGKSRLRMLILRMKFTGTSAIFSILLAIIYSFASKANLSGNLEIQVANQELSIVLNQTVYAFLFCISIHNLVAILVLLNTMLNILTSEAQAQSKNTFKIQSKKVSSSVERPIESTPHI